MDAKRMIWPYFLALAMAFSVGAQTGDGPSPRPTLRLFKGESASLLPWDRLGPREFVNFALWKKELERRENNPEWRRHLGESRLKERVGVVLECRGECQLFRDRGRGQVQFRSLIVEGDEVSTGEDSYLWAFLMDGTLLRLSPQSLVSFREINIGVEENFVHLRVGGGNVLWLARPSKVYRQRGHQETDTLFLPLSFPQANIQFPSSLPSEDDLFAVVARRPTVFYRYQRLNQLIEENNRELFQKPTFVYLVFHNGTVAGRNLSVETIVQVGGKSYFKLRGARQLGLSDFSEGLGQAEGGHFYFRGLDESSPKAPRELSAGQWYEVGERGQQLRPYQNARRFGIGEFVTSNIPTLLIARELMAQRFSRFAHFPLDTQTLAANFGYRLWGSLKRGSGGDLERRLNFLHRHTRLTETMTIISRENLRGQFRARGEKFEQYTYGRHSYSKAMRSYLNYREQREIRAVSDSSLPRQ